MKRLFLLPTILFALTLSAAEYSVGAWRIVLSDKGVANVYFNNNLTLADNNAKFKVGTEEYLLSNLTNQTITDEALTDAFGTGRKVIITATINANIAFVQSYNLYENLNYLLTQIELKSDNSIKSNYIAPVNTTAATTAILPASENRALFVPFDNDEWIRYKSNKFGTTITSYEVGLLYNVTTNEGLVLGSLTHTDWKTGVKTSTESVNKVSSITVYAGASDNITRDSLPHGYVCGLSVKSPLLMIGKFSDWRDAMETFGDLNTIVAPKLTWNASKPFVWNSWGVLQTKISYMNATQNATYIADSIVPLGYQNDGTMYMNLDSYWDNMGYSDLKRFSYNCNQKGLKTGIYWTPFVDWANNPDRQVEGATDGTTYKDIWLYANGQPIKRTGASALDPTHPATKARAKLYIERFLAQGYEFVKLDFMLHGIQEADRWYDSTITTGVQAYNYGMRYVDSLTQGNMYINLSIAPLFPYHYAHGRRIACDAYSSISNSEYTLNSTTYGWWLDHVYSYNDADNVVFKGQQISVNRVRLASSLITGMACIGDDYSLTGDDQAKEHAKKLLNNPELMQMARETKGFRPLVLPQNGDSAASQYYAVVEDTVFVAVFNFSSRRYNYTLSFSGLPLQTGKQYLVHELFRDTYDYATDSYTYPQALARQDAYIFKIYEGEKPEPQAVENIKAVTFSCYPNPTDDMLYLNLPEAADIEVYSMQGQNIMSYSQVQSISTSKFPSGLYTLRATIKDNVYVSSFVHL